MSVWPYFWRLARANLGLYVVTALAFIGALGLPVVAALLLRELFDSLTGEAALEISVWTILALKIGVDAFHLSVVQTASQISEDTLGSMLQARLQTNLFKAVFQGRPRPGRAQRRRRDQSLPGRRRGHRGAADRAAAPRRLPSGDGRHVLRYVPGQSAGRVGRLPAQRRSSVRDQSPARVDSVVPGGRPQRHEQDVRLARRAPRRRSGYTGRRRRVGRSRSLRPARRAAAQGVTEGWPCWTPASVRSARAR